MTSSPERRYTAGVVELRRSAEGVRFGGYALKFRKLSQDLGGFVEQVAGPQTVRKTLQDGGDVLARMHHKDEYLLGRVSSRTLRLTLDGAGLDYDVDRPDTGYARDLEALVARGDVRHSSFAFRTLADDWTLTESGFPLRTLNEVQLIDVAPVVSPAYLDTSSALRSLAGHLDRPAEEVDEVAHAGRLAELIKRPATVLDLRGRHSAPGEHFDPLQPRDGDGKWSDGPGGAVGDAVGALAADVDELDGLHPRPVAEPFVAHETIKTRRGESVGITPHPGGGVKLRVIVVRRGRATGRRRHVR
jgi:HK97 family phage prohead protease